MTLKEECDGIQGYFLTSILCLPILGKILLPTQSFGFLLILSFALLLCYTFYRFKDLENGFETISRLGFGLFYLGLLGAHLVMLRGLPEGAAWLIILSGITAGSDTGAYFCGKNFGKHKLCPNVSPNKTIEGALGGLLAAMGITAGLAYLLLPGHNPLLMMLMAIPLTGVSIIGDLLESIIKRGTGTKDSGSILRGHGGVLDRVDSMLLAGPVLYYMLILLG